MMRQCHQQGFKQHLRIHVPTYESLGLLGNMPCVRWCTQATNGRTAGMDAFHKDQYFLWLSEENHIDSGMLSEI